MGTLFAIMLTDILFYFDFIWFQILLEQKRVAPDGGEINLTSKFNLVDLAGIWFISYYMIYQIYEFEETPLCRSIL